MGVSEIYLNFLRSPCLGRRGLQRLSLAPIAHFPNSNECKCRFKIPSALRRQVPLDIKTNVRLIPTYPHGADSRGLTACSCPNWP